MKSVTRHILIAAGIVSLGLGLLGIVLPVMPTTPFLLFAAWCFVRSSKRLHMWLIEHPVFGCYIRDFESGLGLPLRAKLVSTGLIWVSIPSSTALLYLRLGPRPAWFGAAAFLLACALWGTYYLTWRLPTRRECSPPAEPAHQES